MLQAKTINEKPGEKDGYRLLVAHEWPAKASASFADGFNQALAPSKELYAGLVSGKIAWNAFSQKYSLELDSQTERLQKLKKQSKDFTITIISLPDFGNNSIGQILIRKCDSL